MKKMKKMMAVLVAMVMTLAMGVTAFAQTKALEPADADNASITINNPAKGETYQIYKLFDATVAGDKIAYQSAEAIPESLTEFFEKDSSNNVTLIGGETTEMSENLKAALETWATGDGVTPISEAVSDGSKLEFTGLPYGYYVVITTNTTGSGAEAKSAITVTSTQPNASIFDKNVNKPSAEKTVEKESYSIGDTVKYTATFDTTNYMGVGENSKQVINYLIEDTLPEFLSDAIVTKITIDGEEYLVEGKAPQFEEHTHEDASCKDADGKYVCGYDQKKGIMIPWATPVMNEEDGTVASYTSLYAQGAQIVVTYEATLTSTTNINAADTNTVSIRPFVDNGGGTPDGGDPWDEKWEDDAKITTYAAAIKKVDKDTKEALTGAKFTIAGLVVKPVVENGVEQKGVYKVDSYKPDDATVVPTEMETNDKGILYIVGLEKDLTLTLTETIAPDGYNKLTKPVELSNVVQVLAETIYETSGERYYDEKGNLVEENITELETTTVEKNLSDLDAAAVEVENGKGSLLPSTGGIGTTIFYIVGGVLVIGAAILLVTKKRMSKEA